MPAFWHSWKIARYSGLEVSTDLKSSGNVCVCVCVQSKERTVHGQLVKGRAELCTNRSTDVQLCYQSSFQWVWSRCSGSVLCSLL